MPKRTKTILYITPVLGHPATDGPKLRIENSIKVLNTISKLHILSLASKSNIGGSIGERFYRRVSSKFSYVPSVDTSFFSQLLTTLQNISKYFIKIDISFISFHRDINFIIKYIDNNSIDIIWFGYGNISYNYIKRIKEKRPKSKVVCDTDSVWSRFLSRGLPFLKDKDKRASLIKSIKQKKIEERLGTALADITTAVSNVDAQYYRSLVKGTKKIQLFPNAIDFNRYCQKAKSTLKLKQPNILLIGSFFPDSPMGDAVDWFCEHIFPLVIKQAPHVHCYIAGRDSETFCHEYRIGNIHLLGTVIDTLPLFQQANVLAVPLRFESGTRFKILEAAAAGIPIVTTTLGAEGLELKPKQDMKIADDAKTFAKAIVTLLQNPGLAQKLGRSARQTVKKKYSLEALTISAEKILKSIC